MANEDAARKMLKYLEDSEDLKVSLSELKEQLASPEEAGVSVMQIAKQARNERGQKLLQIFRQEENEVCIASLVRWDTTERIGGAGKALSGTDAGSETICEQQEVLNGMVEDNIRLQSTATEQHYETEEKKSKEALVLVQKNTFCHDVKVKGKDRECCKGWDGRER